MIHCRVTTLRRLLALLPCCALLFLSGPSAHAAEACCKAAAIIRQTRPDASIWV
jgi:hypothetical protein